mmetsp:Transcript_15560/g.14093  ORF Transcript_15560/g.14093 Transcript_15560/m.14093 type:complete len:220 (+) Transcript_15560:37-696(+)|eukprot:CAMPEP_0196761518 /NCGR_PEP_ID=MMETSP1095-20130614/783_1 /TAXON_ID=96789 ORGANISM="Chromulina nebulosa, Strain UTEXLB2642" /NCGR_SAMPLE_ID=MMETSP1095 /ASSEMBLY_ACC=CAM_ASM_000446 /LENGTH=219 /DNA_ID=CAMNT_0042111167 /DNA_START=37 /DNA_END=696 /DNA_ORIENTATION=+
MQSLQVLLSVIIVAIVSAQVAIKGPNGSVVETLDVSKYLGLWYQMYADAIVYNTFEKDSYCATALYGDNGDGTISVHNYAKTGSASTNGTDYTIDGYAYQYDSSYQGKLKVHFDSDDAAPFDAPYWVLELGPVNEYGLYDYAIVSDNINYFLFVLARDVAVFNEKYDATVLAELTTLGFTGVKKPIATYQGTDCVYESTTRKAQIAANAIIEQKFKSTL